MDEQKYFSIRLDVMNDLIKELSSNKELREALGEPLGEKIFFVAVENDILLLPSPESDMSDDERKNLEGLFGKAFQKVLASRL